MSGGGTLPARDEERAQLLQAAVDGELDAAAFLLFERRIAEEPELAAEYGRLKALRGAFRTLPKLQASDDFRARMATLASEAAKPSVPAPAGKGLGRDTGKSSSEWRPSAIAASFALLLGSGLTFLALPPRGSDPMQELVAGHVRGMIAGQPADVATSDKHTVKPWFATRIMDSPRVVDLSSDGFPLVGGRVDVVEDKPVATLVFQHLKHVISVSELPDGAARFGAADTHRTVKGYSVLTWTMGADENKTAYVAISDIAPAELDNLEAAFRKAVAADK